MSNKWTFVREVEVIIGGFVKLVNFCMRLLSVLKFTFLYYFYVPVLSILWLVWFALDVDFIFTSLDLQKCSYTNLFWIKEKYHKLLISFHDFLAAWGRGVLNSGGRVLVSFSGARCLRIMHSKVSARVACDAEHFLLLALQFLLANSYAYITELSGSITCILSFLLKVYHKYYWWKRRKFFRVLVSTLYL